MEIFYIKCDNCKKKISHERKLGVNYETVEVELPWHEVDNGSEFTTSGIDKYHFCDIKCMKEYKFIDRTYGD